MATEGSYLRVNGGLRIPLSELEFRATGSGGPGGQHANTANTRVEAHFDIERSPSLGPRQRAKLLERFGPALRVVASDSRSQSRNRQLVIERLGARLADALRVERPRVDTRPTRGSKVRRVEAKRQRSRTKQQRRPPGVDD